jgi:two-component system, LytTR family, response regulator
MTMGETDRKLRVVLADDEPMGRASIKALLARDSEIELVAECANGMEAVAAVREMSPDILFLDVQMPGMGGFDVIEALEAGELPVIVFATAYDQYAVDAFEVHAVDYLLKPFDDERFATALSRAKDRVVSRSTEEQERDASELLTAIRDSTADTAERQEGITRRLSIHREGRVDIVDTDDLQWVEAADQYVQLHTTGGDLLMRKSMSYLEANLDPERFLRTHRSAIVAIAEIRTLERHGNGGGRVRISDGIWVPVSRSRMAVLRKRLA